MWGTLALEIIFEIFGHFLPGLKVSITEHHQFPWYLGQVCMTWRNAFLTFPQLWSTLDIDLAKQHPDHTTLEHNLAMVEECLLRSGNHTISFRFTLWQSFQCRGLSPSPSPEALCCGQILDRLVEQSNRWRDAYFTLHICKAETHRVKIRLPMLRSLQCRFVRYDTEVDMQDFNNLLVDAPRLTRIFLDESIKWNIDWSSMTAIHFQSPPKVTYLLSCLKQAHRLEELVIRDRFAYGSFSPNTISPITLPYLKVLEVCVTGLLLFETPALEELHTTSGIVADFRYEWIASSYIGSLHHLRKLSVEPQDLYVRYSNSDVLKVLPACRRASELRTLTIALWSHKGREDLSRIITGWEKQRHAVAGFGPFNNLTKISIVFLKESGLRAKSATITPLQHVLDSLRRHFEDQGMQYSIQQCDVFGAGVNVPLFDTL
ncbi:hypothetical protein JOM56_012288 [Amanita muscaria]